MLKYNETKSKSGVELAEHLVSFYRAQEGYFKDGSALLQALKNWEAKFTTDTQQVDTHTHTHTHTHTPRHHVTLHITFFCFCLSHDCHMTS